MQSRRRTERKLREGDREGLRVPPLGLLERTVRPRPPGDLPADAEVVELDDEAGCVVVRDGAHHEGRDAEALVHDAPAVDARDRLEAPCARPSHIATARHKPPRRTDGAHRMLPTWHQRPGQPPGLKKNIAVCCSPADTESGRPMPRAHWPCSDRDQHRIVTLWGAQPRTGNFGDTLAPEWPEVDSQTRDAVYTGMRVSCGVAEGGVRPPGSARAWQGPAGGAQTARGWGGRGAHLGRWLGASAAAHRPGYGRRG